MARREKKSAKKPGPKPTPEDTASRDAALLTMAVAALAPVVQSLFAASQASREICLRAVRESAEQDTRALAATAAAANAILAR